MYIFTAITRFLIKMLGGIAKLVGLQSKKMAIIIRTDLNMGRGKIAAQSAHAAILLYQSALDNSSAHLNWWLRTGQAKIVLKVNANCDETLKNLYQRAKELNLNVCMVRDAGRTQVETGSVTAVGIGPDSNEVIEKLTSSFKLL